MPTAGCPATSAQWTRDDWISAIDSMMLCHIEMMRLTVDGMMARGFGRIVNIVSRSVKMPQLELGLSNGARSGLVGFTAGLARQTIRHNVTINNLLPGTFDTDGQREHVRGMVDAKNSYEKIWQRTDRAEPGRTLRAGRRARRLLRVPLLGAGRLHHGTELADRWRKLSGDSIDRDDR